MPRAIPIHAPRRRRLTQAAAAVLLAGSGAAAVLPTWPVAAAATAQPATGTAPASATAKPATRASTPFYATRYERQPDVPTLTRLGQSLFFAQGLSASGRQSCASCHDPAHGMTPPNALSVQPGGAALHRSGVRAAPTLKYLSATPTYTEHFFESDGNDSEDQGPTGGLMWDGRVNQPHEQAALPLLSPFEMGNASPAEVLARLRKLPQATDMRAAFGAHVLDAGQDELAWRGLLLALEVFLQDPATFSPYSSKYDAWLRHQARLSPAEQRGLDLFNDPARGNCAQCHVSAIRAGGFPQFTDHGLLALGVPRNRAIPANRDPRYFDLGLCGPYRTDQKDHPENCGRFKTPTLRNVALKQSYFHNGVMHRLEDVVRFYSERDVHPEKFYPRAANGRVQRYDDLPARYRANLDDTAPFDDPKRSKPLFNEAEIRDVVAFLHTLTDGYQPAQDK